LCALGARFTFPMPTIAVNREGLFEALGQKYV